MDTLFALVLCLAAELEVVAAGLPASSAAVAACVTLPLAARRRAPVLALLTIVSVLLLDDALGGAWGEEANIGVLVHTPTT